MPFTSYFWHVRQSDALPNWQQLLHFLTLPITGDPEFPGRVSLSYTSLVLLLDGFSMPQETLNGRKLLLAPSLADALLELLLSEDPVFYHLGWKV